MSDILTPEQQAWLSEQVARGEFPSVEQAARQLIDESISFRAEIERDDLTWAKLHVDEALEQAERDDVMTREEHRARLSGLLAPKG